MTQEQFIIADRLYDEGDYENAFKLFLELATMGDTSAMTRLAHMYSAAKGAEYDFDKIIYWERKAADLGDVTALFNLGISYRNSGDVRNARKWFEYALELGDGDAALEIAKLYLISDKEIETVRKYLEIAMGSKRITESSKDEVLNLMNEFSSENK